MKSSTKMAYFFVIAIWSTTPLAIKLSSEGLHPLTGVGARMFIATWCAYLLVKLSRKSIPLSSGAIKNYLSGGLGLFGGLTAVYFSVAHVPTGLISVLYGLSPIVSGVLAYYLIDDPPFSFLQWLALFLSVIGLAFVFLGDITFNLNLLYGVGLVLLSVLCFSLSGVLVKRHQVDCHPLEQTTGTLIVCLPLFLISSASAGELPAYASVPGLTKWAILYLALIGSIAGLLSYYHVLREMSPGTVALSTVVTPVIALFLGATFNGEVFSAWAYFGVFLILFGLIIFNWGDKLLLRAD